ncbi:hypothetical protein B0H14DRAFT_3719069 [Mycena olivaceomarginata]|nr:hypothetical protein B0H14DRAFT_3719069 [Mycena olivaceomarginata]
MSTLRAFFENAPQQRTVLEALLYSLRVFFPPLMEVCRSISKAHEMVMFRYLDKIRRLCPYVNPTWQLEQTVLTNDPAPSMERLVERARRCIVVYGGICHILAIISEVEVPAMVSSREAEEREEDVKIHDESLSFFIQSPESGLGKLMFFLYPIRQELNQVDSTGKSP